MKELGEAIHDRSFLVFDEGEFWRRVPGYADIDSETFQDPNWQARNSVRTPQKMADLLGVLASSELIDDVAAGLDRSTMAMRITPYTFSLIDWTDPWADPLRRQFIPLLSEAIPDHPGVALDSLEEVEHSPAPGLVRRYPDKALLIAVDTCPVYCTFCTRSYAVGPASATVSKLRLPQDIERWREALDWLRRHPEVSDLVLSGGDAFSLSARHLRLLLEELLKIGSIRRIRVATKGLAVLPSRFTMSDPWTAALIEMIEKGRALGVAIYVHTHFNHPREITWITAKAARLLFERGVVVRNQAVLLRGVNDRVATQVSLVRRLAHIHVQPYYMYLADMVRGTEGLRTSLQTAIDLEKAVRGVTAGFNTPTFVVDLPGGGGKRGVHSFESYDRATGLSIYQGAGFAADRQFAYQDPAPAAAPVGEPA